MTDGLVNKQCEHERQEYREMSWGEESWICLDCNEILLRYIDSIGG